jgi:hypothetical protein
MLMLIIPSRAGGNPRLIFSSVELSYCCFDFLLRLLLYWLAVVPPVTSMLANRSLRDDAVVALMVEQRESS